MSSSAALYARQRGGAVGGGVLKRFRVELHITVRFPVSQLSSLNPQLNKAALRLWVNPVGSQARHFPYIALTRDTEEDIAGNG